MTRKELRETLDYIQSRFPHLLFILDDKSKHYKLYLQVNNKAISVPMSRTPSDFRHREQVARQIRHVLIKENVLDMMI